MTTENTTATQQPTLHDLLFDVHYGHWYNLMCERLYRRLDVLLNLLQLVGGSGAAVAVVSQSASVLAGVGVVLAVTSAIALLVQPAIKAHTHGLAKGGYTLLMSDGPQLQPHELAVRLAQVRMGAPTGPQSLQAPAFNATLHAMGYTTGFMETGRMQRLVAALA